MTRIAIATILALTAAHAIGAQSSSCAPAGGLTFICGVANPEDFVLVPNTR